MEDTTTVDIDALIDEARPAERSMPLCLRGDLVARWEELDRARVAAASAKSPGSLAGAGGEAAAIVVQMEELREQMAAATVTVTVRALPRPEYQKLSKSHPPRRTEDGKIHEDDVQLDVNMETFPEALIRGCWVSPVINKDRMTKLLDEILTDRQFEQLANLALVANRGDVDVPFSLAASRPPDSSSPDSDSLDS